jgi:hypothetical protein
VPAAPPGRRCAEDVPDELRVGRTAHLELEFLDDAGDHSDRELIKKIWPKNLVIHK